ncbi:T9SS type A sorting domain-containing protein [Rhodocaloribacter sp.]
MYAATKFRALHPFPTILWTFSLLMLFAASPALAQGAGEDQGEGEEPIIVTDQGGYQSAQRALRRGTLGTALDSTRVTTFGGEDQGEGEEPIIVTDQGGYQSAQREQAFRADVAGARDETPPASPTLLGNYPNPFNPTTTINFNLPEAQPVRLAVFNVLGQQVQVLADGPMEAGRHEVRFLAGDLPSGLYLARLATPSGVIVQSMLLAK